MFLACLLSLPDQNRMRKLLYKMLHAVLLTGGHESKDQILWIDLLMPPLDTLFDPKSFSIF